MYSPKPTTFLPVKIWLSRETKMRQERKVTDIDGDKMDLCMSVLSGLRGRHVHDLAGAT